MLNYQTVRYVYDLGTSTLNSAREIYLELSVVNSALYVTMGKGFKFSRVGCWRED